MNFFAAPGCSVHRPAESGFTLIEVMVALVVVAVALPAFLTLIMSQLDGTAAIRDKTMAFWVAENELTRLQLRQELLPDFDLPDRDSGETELAGLEWHWQLESEATQMDGFRQVTVSAGLEPEPEASLAKLAGFVHVDE